MNEIKKAILERFQPTLDTIERQSNCDHKWSDKNGAAYYRCRKCGYLADNQKINKLIGVQRLIDKGMPVEDIERYKRYL
jgi:tRNA(Ile2) C34 agmatinyltransferase TiaS